LQPPAGWAGEIARDYQRRAAKPPSADEIAQEREAVLGRLRKDWGDATEKKLAQVRDLVLRAGRDDQAEKQYRELRPRAKGDDIAEATRRADDWLARYPPREFPLD
jgi:hypothetical protein